MMKKITLILILVAFLMNGFAQTGEENIDNQAIISTLATETIDATYEIDSTFVDYVFDETEENTIADTIKIKAGKPYAFLINIAEYPVQIVGDNLETEKYELQTNFKDKNLEVFLISEHCFLSFESGQGLDMTDFEMPYTATAFWSGEKYDEIEITGYITNTTEFVAAQMGLEKESSYNITARKNKIELSELKQKDYVTENSKIALKKYFQMFQTPILAENEEFWFIQDIPKIKTIKIYMTENGKKTSYSSCDFDTLGHITQLTFYKKNNKIDGLTKFIYKDEMLIEIEQKDHSTKVNYDDQKIIFSEMNDDVSQVVVFTLENNLLLSTGYVIMQDNANSNQNYTFEDKIEGNCIVTYLNGAVINKSCSSTQGVFPYFNEYTSYQSAAANQEPDFLQYTKYKIEQKSANTFEKYYSNAENENEPDIYEYNSSIYLNESNLISKMTNKKIDLDIVYIYYP